MRIRYGRLNVIKKTILYSKKSSIDKEFSSLSSYLLATNDLISHYNYSANQQNTLAASWSCVFVFSLSVASKSVVLNGQEKQPIPGSMWKSVEKEKTMKNVCFHCDLIYTHSHTHSIGWASDDVMERTVWLYDVTQCEATKCSTSTSTSNVKWILSTFQSKPNITCFYYCYSAEKLTAYRATSWFYTLFHIGTLSANSPKKKRNKINTKNPYRERKKNHRTKQQQKMFVVASHCQWNGKINLTEQADGTRLRRYYFIVVLVLM